MDALSEILESIKFKGVVYQKLELSSPWGLEMPQDANSQFWRLLKGNCYLKVPGEEVLKLKEGDLVLIPHGSSHWMADQKNSKRLPAEQFIKARLNGQHPFNGKGNETIMIGGHFSLESKPTHPFVKDLPKVIHIYYQKSNEHSWLQLTATQIYEEVNRERPGSKILIDSLVKVVFIHTIRTYLEQTSSPNGFLLALRDERISKALKLIQGAPEKDWKLEVLSKYIGMSRTLFCTKFKDLVGETSLSYLTNWRMIKAKEILLSSPEINIRDVATQVGYQAEASFNRIFKLKTGQTPANYRRKNLLR